MTTASVKQPSMAPKNTIVNWPCLNDSPIPMIAQKTQPLTQKTFEQALNNVCDIPMSQLPKPSWKGDDFAIQIPDDEYDIGLEACKNNLHARVIWPKGATPLTVYALREKLKPLWKSLGRWGVTSLGKGYYEFCFSSVEDARSVRSVASWNLNPGVLKLFPWTKEFDLNTQRNASAQVWLRIYGLSQEYWRPKILFAIASSVGTPICTDTNTGKSMLELTFGHFARVLVDIDLTCELKYKVLVERKGFAKFVNLDYERIPEYCKSCSIIGHTNGNCRKNMKKLTEESGKNQAAREGNKGKGKDDIREKEPEVNNVEKEADTNGGNDTEIILGDNVKKAIEVAASDDSHQNRVPHNDLQVDENADSDNNEDSSSKFVDATQLQDEDDRSSTQSSTHKVPTPERVQKDMCFLHESWANLAEKETEDLLTAAGDVVPIVREDMEESSTRKQNELIIDEAILNEEQRNIQESGFQVVINKKKAQKSKASQVKSSYSTRSKPSNPKPFR